ncbi:putative lipo protein [Exidia glandulosa HHB12029]|uniref:Putative lipo protein n=1 Tax=Exidia glandulosa HHB12029 TaxID=1314781 RepID=A0A165R187_EXIGL|nr:putative lipo protein [Exidia glandulosa HHB12029]
MRLWIASSTALALFVGAAAGKPEYHTFPSLRERAAIQDAWTAKRLEAIPSLLKKHNVDAWILSQREYAEDTVFWSFKPATSFSARRRTLMVFHTNTSSLVGARNPLTWIDNTPTVWNELRDTLEAFDPQAIALNIDSFVAFADGMHAGELELLSAQLGTKWMERTVRKPMLAVEFIATRVSEQLAVYKDMQETIWAMIAEGFSSRIITPGKTTTSDVVWWFREKMQERNVTTWFHPSVSVFRPANSSHGSSQTIHFGDMLHTDIGITAFGLNTDTQHVGYVLQPGEDDVPAGLKAGLRKSNRMQDIVLKNMQPGKTGNQVLTECLEDMAEENIAGLVYCHPIGDWGHAAGSLIGMTNLPTGVPVLGDLPILPQTYYSIELSASHFVEEWNVTIPFQQEEDVAWSDETEQWEWVWGRQEEFHIVDAAASVAPGSAPSLVVQ